ncbi:MAG: hypothetical protein GF310_02920 [candidate division Zixibacteria bacterium]|nr:hypothetical protein [candidate division Zixibacteria bacterium]
MAPQNPARGKTAGKTGKKPTVKKPFKVFHHKRRKYVRLEVNSPLKFKTFNPMEPDLKFDENETCEGRILNISGGGVLFETDYTVRENDYLVLEMTLADADTISGIIGKVKRVDTDEGTPLVGIEFMSPEKLKAELPSHVLDKIGEEIYSFDEQLRKMLLKYVFTQKVEKA